VPVNVTVIVIVQDRVRWQDLMSAVLHLSVLMSSS
jgi:hypothetical protein